jgi:hypothetical protein
MGKALAPPQGAGTDPREGQWHGGDNPGDDHSKCQYCVYIDSYWGQSLPRSALDEKKGYWFLFSFCLHYLATLHLSSFACIVHIMLKEPALLFLSHGFLLIPYLIGLSLKK